MASGLISNKERRVVGCFEIWSFEELVIGERTSRGCMRANSWGMLSVAFLAVAFVVVPICTRFVHDEICFIPYARFQLTALACSIVAAVRGTKLWTLLSLLCGLLIVQTAFAVLVE